MNISYRRNPYVQLVLYPALVQGDNAPASIERGIKTLDEYGLDVIIIGRGGGSIEDLWAFNDELVIEAVFAAKTPIISAVGHETDFTIADFVADLRAPTPSAAAELAVCDIAAVQSYIFDLNTRLNDRLQSKIFNLRHQLDNLSLQLKFLNPVAKSQEKRQRLIALEASLTQEFTHLVENKKHQLQVYAARLEGLSPLGKLSQGYSYVEHEDGRRIACAGDVKVKDKMKVYFKDGIVTAEALEVINGKGTDT
jgi:exodeoxyribonuclease VII large subunit